VAGEGVPAQHLDGLRRSPQGVVRGPPQAGRRRTTCPIRTTRGRSWTAFTTWAARPGFFRPLKPIDAGEKPFGQPWEARAFALTLLANRAATSSNLHAFRHALERVPETEYLADYYGRWLGSAEILLVDSGLLAPGAVEARARKLRVEQVEEPVHPEPHQPTRETAGGEQARHRAA
jgi:hypothetical protein